jgi:predicted NAD-dependent protein-ADP-ribosyltransferase YbiA (DUF1768 family)
VEVKGLLLQNLEKLHITLETVKRFDQFHQNIENNKAKITANKSSIQALENRKNLLVKAYNDSKKIFEKQRGKALLLKDKDEDKAKQKTPAAEAQTTLQTPDATGKWNIDLNTKATPESPLYMLGNVGEAPANLSAEETGNLKEYGFHENYAFLSASDTSNNLTVNGKPYKSPLHFVLQSILSDDPEIIQTISQEKTGANALQIACQKRANKECIENNRDEALKYLKEAMSAKFIYPGGMPNPLGEALMKTSGKELIATNEIAPPQWGWGATMSEDKTTISGSNLLGKYLVELRDSLIAQEKARIAPTIPPIGTPTPVTGQ